jgi:hypothetical protein
MVLGVSSCASHHSTAADVRYTADEAEVWTLVFRDLFQHHPAPRAYLTVDRVQYDYVDPPPVVFHGLAALGVPLERASLLNDPAPLAEQPRGQKLERHERITVYSARIVGWESPGPGTGFPAARVEASYYDGPLSGGGYELVVRRTADGWRAFATGKTWAY